VEAEQVKKAQKQASLAQPKHSVQETRSSKLRNAALMSKNGGPSDMPATLRNSRDSLASNAFSIQVRSPHPKVELFIKNMLMVRNMK
jgi:hypothetical protein